MCRNIFRKGKIPRSRAMNRRRPRPSSRPIRRSSRRGARGLAFDDADGVIVYGRPRPSPSPSPRTSPSPSSAADEFRPRLCAAPAAASACATIIVPLPPGTASLSCHRRRRRPRRIAAAAGCCCAWLASLAVAVVPIDAASRAYPHGCLYRHPSYYTYENNDQSAADAVDAAATSTSGVDGAAGAGGGRPPGGAREDLQHVDFTRLPPPSSSLRLPYERYRITRRLGAGKFSDVFEAVDADRQRDADVNADVDCAWRAGEAEIHPPAAGGTSGEDWTTDRTKEGSGYNADANGSVDPRTLVVVKCLKPVSTRKIRRELLVLTHCSSLPNLARLVGVVLPESFDCDVARERDGRGTSGGGAGGAAAHGEAYGTKDDESGGRSKNRLPALVLEHAGPESRWMCHGLGGGGNKRGGAAAAESEGAGYYLDELETKYYLCHLLIALDALHAAGIMHRDVKPRNCLINRHRRRTPGRRRRRPLPPDDALDERGEEEDDVGDAFSPSRPPPLMLIDLGLADFYLPGQKYNVRVASRHYKSPELLIGYEYYDYAIDLWGVGCILAGLLFRREPFFRGKDNEDQLGKIVAVLGTRDLLPYCRKCNVRLSQGARAAIAKHSPRTKSVATGTETIDGRRQEWSSLLPPSCPTPDPVALDLLDRLLVYDHDRRLTAREALAHAFFDDVRDGVWEEVRRRALWEEEDRERRRRG